MSLANLPTRAEDLALPHYVYVCYDADGWVLYVGMSKNVSARIQQHLPSWWTDHVRHVQTIGPMPYDDARELEARLIWRLAPIVNRQYNRVWTDHENLLRYEAGQRQLERQRLEQWPQMVAAQQALRLPLERAS